MVFQEKAIHQVICTAPTEIITVPNVFTPNNDLVNDFFRPVLSFTPVALSSCYQRQAGQYIV